MTVLLPLLKHPYVHACMYKCACTYVHVCMYKCLYVKMYVQMHVYVMYVCTYGVCRLYVYQTGGMYKCACKHIFVLIKCLRSTIKLIIISTGMLTMNVFHIKYTKASVYMYTF